MAHPTPLTCGCEGSAFRVFPATGDQKAHRLVCTRCGGLHRLAAPAPDLGRDAEPATAEQRRAWLEATGQACEVDGCLQLRGTGLLACPMHHALDLAAAAGELPVVTVDAATQPRPGHAYCSPALPKVPGTCGHCGEP